MQLVAQEKDTSVHTSLDSSVEAVFSELYLVFLFAGCEVDCEQYAWCGQVCRLGPNKQRLRAGLVQIYPVSKCAHFSSSHLSLSLFSLHTFVAAEAETRDLGKAPSC
jgi:hypothetical protein